MNDPKLNVDESKLNEFMGKALGDMGAAINTALILIGDRLGLYKAMARSEERRVGNECSA